MLLLYQNFHETLVHQGPPSLHSQPCFLADLEDSQGMLLLIGKNLLSQPSLSVETLIPKTYLGALCTLVSKSSLPLLFRDSFLPLVLDHFFNQPSIYLKHMAVKLMGTL